MPTDTPQRFRQIKVSEIEERRLQSRIDTDFLSARSNHEARIAKFIRIWRMWRGLQTTQSNQDGPAFEVPMLKWVTLGQWAKAMQSLLGDDAEVIAKPTAPSDAKSAVKVGHYMTWRVFDYMKGVIALTTWVFRAILFGRAHAELEYVQEYYWERDTVTAAAKRFKVKPTLYVSPGFTQELDLWLADPSQPKPKPTTLAEFFDSGELDWESLPMGYIDYEQLSYDGPRLIPLWPSDMILPAQDNVQCVDDFEWKGRRRKYTPQELLDGERRGKFQNIRDNWDKIMAHAQLRQERDYWYDDEKIASDEAEGVDHSTVMGNRDSVECWEWYMKWRFLKGKQDGRLENLDRRSDREKEIIVKYLPKVGLIVGIQDLRDLMPRLKKRTPFLDLGIIKDGSYWTPGLGELLEDLQNEASINHGLMRSAGMFSAGPLIFYTPGGAYDPNTVQYEPRMHIPCADPKSVNVVKIDADMRYPEMMSQILKTFAELVTGQSDQSLGQSSDRPNAPRTASGQAMLINEGNVRVSLDLNMLREDINRFVEYVWMLDREYADPEVFFRVTDEDAAELYDNDQGFGTMTAEERMHPFDFDVKFATSLYSREAKKAAMLQLYQLSLANPILQTNPRALWVLLNRVWEAFGEKNFADIIPRPPEVDAPKDPKEEWALLMKGEEVDPNPMDDDQAHILDHRKRLAVLLEEPAERKNPRVQAAAVAHIVAHEHQMRQKMILQVIVQRALAEAQATGQPAPGIAEAPAPGQPQPGQVPAVGPPNALAAPAGPIMPSAQGGPTQ